MVSQGSAYLSQWYASATTPAQLAAMQTYAAGLGGESGVSVSIEGVPIFQAFGGGATPYLTPLTEGGNAGGATEQNAIAALVAQGLAWLIRMALSKWGLSAIVATLLGLVSREAIQGELGQMVATIVPGLQPGLGEFPPGLGEIQGRLMKRWRAGLAFFAQFEQPSKRGTTIRTYCWIRGAWRPIRLPRNIVIGAKELRLASTLGHKRRIGKRRVLQIIASPARRFRERWHQKHHKD